MRLLIKLAIYIPVLVALLLMACGRGIRWVFRQLRFYYWKYTSNPPQKGPITKWEYPSTSALPQQRYR